MIHIFYDLLGKPFATVDAFKKLTSGHTNDKMLLHAILVYV